MNEDMVQLSPGSAQGTELDTQLAELMRAREALASLSPISNRGGGDDWDAPFDLRVIRPRAIDLRRLWQLTEAPEPPTIAAAQGRPILLNHVITPYPPDGLSPRGVWGLGYEFVALDGDMDTVSVVPNDEVLEIGRVGQDVDLGMALGGAIRVPDVPLTLVGDVLPVSLTGASIRASTNQTFQFSLKMRITLRKVIGSGVGEGGAMWKLYRQDEPLDRPHALLQTVMVPETSTSIRCLVKTWAKQAGWFGTEWGARFWPYADQQFEIRLPPAASARS